MECDAQDEHALLWDIFRYLSENLSGEMLSDTADNERKALLERLSCVFPDLPSTYLDMNGKSHCDEDYIVTDVSENKKDRNVGLKIRDEKYSNVFEYSSNPILKHASPENTCTQMNISYRELCTKAMKFGPLLRRERLFFLDQFRRCWAGLVEHTLLLYTGERDTKPVFSLNVQGFSARRATNILTKDQKKKDLCFEVVCPGQKTYHFIARTVKDMDQWVAAICEASEHEPCLNQRKPHQTLRKLPSLPREDVELYDDVTVFRDSGEEIYHDISDMQPSELLEDKKSPLVGNHLTELQVSGQKKGNDLSEEEYKEIIYDDVNSLFAFKDFGNSVDLNKPQQQNTVSQREIIEKIHENSEDNLEMYDDIGTESTSFKKANSSTQKTNIGLIDKNFGEQIKASIFKMKNSSGLSKVKITTASKTDSSEELYEAIENPVLQ
ncbi:src kinase-associated phosphoprotein 2-A-like [Bacillus rossius redtenbacheri]|uniref:src kinase-associated phosphoprotein 2-A-like n=1 Tax=Bacillus rossius redtenbacheri TaxID=93214 RepID=UPI002FDD80D9